ncbi:MAG TPA: MBL fold metallo-hydrolase [Anaerovoracaceae bacterium]|nr:MBL fold metallo-hydrolase [Anaerovoracaceae bacterium]
MLPVYKIPVPTPYAVGPVNSYLIKARPYTLIDPGPETNEAKEALGKGLNAAGVDIGDIERVVLTHSHSDHCGLANFVCDNSGAKTWVHPYELAKITGGFVFVKDKLPIIVETGVPGYVLEEVARDRDHVPPPYLDPKDAVPVEGGEHLHFDNGSYLRVMHMPGHAIGHICLHAPETGEFFAGDFLLAHITPNPVMELDPENPNRRVRTLKQYLNGLKVIEGLDLTTVWTGHGENIYNHREIVQKGREHHLCKMKKILGILRDGKKNAYETSRVLYPHIKGYNILLGISEALAHLDYLSDDGKLAQVQHNGVTYFKVA